MVSRWREWAVTSRKRIADTKSFEKGHFAVYTSEGKRFVVPLAYLNNLVMLEIFRMAEDEYGMDGKYGNGPIVLPFDGDFMEYAISLIEISNSGEDIEERLIVMSMLPCGRLCLSSSLFVQHDQTVCSF
ncbi:auxin-responsive protein SAUR68-like [Impatiens glandulifera]|uniref:auxin-responsive protein SAUR68-like n=1 Tax=Impatiens glandulifera TaxID=253017 RepID=UPI001FB1649E|nr:auxin-responsive protein SAUR68-like [Impatiens glandulifera]